MKSPFAVTKRFRLRGNFRFELLFYEVLTQNSFFPKQIIILHIPSGFLEWKTKLLPIENL